MLIVDLIFFKVCDGEEGLWLDSSEPVIEDNNEIDCLIDDYNLYLNLPHANHTAITILIILINYCNHIFQEIIWMIFFNRYTYVWKKLLI